MPVYTCTTTTSTLTAETKSALAQEITRIHSEINHVPTTYVDVVFHELPAGDIYTDGVPANPVLVNGWVRSGHPTDKTTRLATEIADAVSRIANVPADRVMMVIQNSPASGAVEGGRVLPEPGQEQAWIAANDK
ncbi:tautomerase family protein [Mycobacterium sp.]|jgi:phenylpyruvate tautomerase PptA (4-oxalocrotonate tautomerase family)|uniref:tautomerase family protein n=1 Tax=Mycobacterium sp. TaxID=1785 RepID=UPI002BE6897C|nr:tautomerase family protein [Mycobacterium sp.]HXB86408.1 tautomerase family protein [Mycobacterium sp.]